MSAEVDAFLAEAAALAAWIEQTYPDGRPDGGEWECGYDGWPGLYAAWRRLVATCPLPAWSPALRAAALEVLARDNECQQIARATPRADVVALSIVARAGGEHDARWQLAIELADPAIAAAAAEPELVILADDPDEYVRRRAVQSLARRHAATAESLAVREWRAAAPDLPWTRMNALWCLHHLGSAALPTLLAEADASPDPLLRDYAARVRAGTAT
ncbi:MAG: HEAT repeat domain-containing protein [Kofleriaceae bacterium]|nr:HEAT repeat domain-containing protein [Kofleriaceae bacterium]